MADITSIPHDILNIIAISLMNDVIHLSNTCTSLHSLMTERVSHVRRRMMLLKQLIKKTRRLRDTDHDGKYVFANTYSCYTEEWFVACRQVTEGPMHYYRLSSKHDRFIYSRDYNNTEDDALVRGDWIFTNH